jgi:AraC-like DNA-binding protein
MAYSIKLAPPAFRRRFRREIGVSPLEYRRTFRAA